MARKVTYRVAMSYRAVSVAFSTRRQASSNGLAPDILSEPTNESDFCGT